jgi:hypothetical protein
MLDYGIVFARDGWRQEESKAAGKYYPTHSYTKEWEEGNK